MSWPVLVKRIMKDLQIENEEIAARLAAAIVDMNSGIDATDSLVELHFHLAKSELNPKDKAMLDLKAIVLFALKQQEYADFVNDEQPMVDAKAKLHKITYLALRDLAQKGYKVPDTDFQQSRFGTHSPRQMETAIAHLQKEGYVRVEANPATFSLTQEGSSRVEQIAISLDWWPEFLSDLVRSLLYWLVATKVAWNETQQYTKALEDLHSRQERLAHQSAEGLLPLIDTKVRPVLDIIKRHELPPVESLDDPADLPRSQTEYLQESIERMINRSKITVGFPESVPCYVVETQDDLFLNETGRLTNFYVTQPTSDQSRKVFREVLSILGETKSRKLILGLKEWDLLKQFRWAENAISIFVYDQSGNVTPLGPSKELFPADRVVVFTLRDLPILDEIMKRVNLVTPNVTLFISVCRNYYDAVRWNEKADIKIRVWPHDISMRRGHFLPAQPFSCERLRQLARYEKLDIAKALRACLMETTFGSILSPRGQPLGLVVNKAKLYSDLLAQYQRAVRLSATQILEMQPAAILATSELRLAGEVAEILNIPLCRIFDSSDGETKLGFGDKHLGPQEFVTMMRDKTCTFVAFSDTDVTEGTLSTLASLVSLGLRVKTFVLFDMLELETNTRHYLKMDSLVSLPDFSLLREIEPLILNEMAFRALINKVIADEAISGRPVPSIHKYQLETLSKLLEDMRLSLKVITNA